MNEKTEYWLELAEYDIETAAAMLQTKRFLYVGFMCHQCIEKALKAVLASQNVDLPPKIHNLIRLSEMCGLIEKLKENQKQTIFLLNPLNIESRYPSYKENLFEQLTDERCNQIINDTKELFTWIKTQL